MSAIIAGNKCNECGAKNWYISFGHPKWYDEVIKYGKEKNDIFKSFERMGRSGLCPKCYLLSITDGIEKNPEKYSDDFIATIFAITRITKCLNTST